MDLNITWRKAEEVTHGTLLQGELGSFIRGISTDTRRIKAGDAFLALKGDKFDGNDYQLQAADGGAAGFIVLRRSNRVPVDAPVLRVPDTLVALQDIAAYHRGRFKLKVAAVAGTNGKTTTKQILAAICAAAGPTVASAGNLNNQIGLPLSLLEIEDRHAYGVFEMGSSNKGDIELLTKLARPHVGVITNIGRAHLQFFGTLEASRDTELELVETMGPEGRVAINLDDPMLAPTALKLGMRAVTFGTAPEAAVRYVPGPAALLIISGKPLPLEPREKLLRFHPMNAAAAAAGAVALGIPVEAIAEGFRTFTPAALRMEERRRADGAILLVDAYNANPDSVRESLRVFCACYPDRRLVAVLGDMKELGPGSAAMHAETGAYLKTLPLKAAFLGGPEMAPAAKALEGAAFPVRFSDDPKAWLDDLKRAVTPDSAVLFKASRAMAFEKLAEQL